MAQAPSLIRSAIDSRRFDGDEFVNVVTHALGLALTLCRAIVMLTVFARMATHGVLLVAVFTSAAS